MAQRTAVLPKEKKVSKKALREEKQALVHDWLVEAALDERRKQGTATNRVASIAVARERIFLEDFEEVASRAVSGKAVAKGYSLKEPSNKPCPRILNLVLSDLHFGADLDPGECPSLFDAHVEARRLAWIVLQTAEFKLDHRKETELHVHILGDIIQNQLHDPRDGKPLAQQVLSAMSYLGQAIEFLAEHFPKVVVDCSTGNHGRNTARHRERATNQKWDSIETMVYAGVRAHCRTLKNVSFRILKRAFYTQDFFGAKGYFTHGDTNFDPGYPGKSINVGGMKAQADSMNGALDMTSRYELFVVGHVHIGSITHLPGGATVITNGCLIPPDAYGGTIGITHCTCGQWLWESVRGHVVGDLRFVTIDPSVDGNVELETIVRPYIPTDEL